VKVLAKSIKDFRRYWRHYVIQSAVATIAFALILIVHPNKIITASLAATTFIIFAMPGIITAQPRRVIGGHLVGLICGTLCYFIPHHSPAAKVCVFSFTVGVSMFIMVITDTEHPPAAGTALGIVYNGISFHSGFIVFANVIILSLIHQLFRKHLRDLH
jgi:CBS-domain-containing membrane protein